MENKKKLRDILKSILQWPLMMSVVFVLTNVYIYFVDTRAGIFVTVAIVIYAGALAVIYVIKSRSLTEELVRFGVNYGQVQRKLLGELAVPYVIVDTDGHILWANRGFFAMSGEKLKNRQLISTIFPEIDKSVFPAGSECAEINLESKGASYRVELRNIIVDSFSGDSYWNSEKRSPKDTKDNTLVGIYLYDETLINKLKKDIVDQEMIIGLLYIDNYDEALESIDEVRRSLLTALVDRKINKYFQNFDTVIKKIEKDKYVLVFQNQYLEQLKAAKFPILDEVRAVNIGNEMSVTISLGIGVKAGTYTRAYEAARAAIDLALGRGGDQVVIKENDTVSYYGGKSGSVEKNTRVKSRVKAHALREIMEVKDKVLIMGHAMPDVDAFGAAVGVYRIATNLNKEAHIVLDEITSSVRVMVSRFTTNPDYSNMIISKAQALEMIDAMTLVVVVDVNRPSYTECPELLERAKSIVVLDHHRQSGDGVENAALSYVETSASSACEVVAEIIQYIGDGFRLKPVEADAMYAGIMIDSNNFLTKTGIRTFEAAAFLRRNGADVTRIRKAFRTDMPDYLARARSIASTQMFMDNYALAVCDPGEVESPTILGAQVANELMDISNIKASFVFTEYNNLIYVSARSIDEVNVQVIMEKMGGGGHMSVAGAQFADCGVEEAIERVKKTLTAMIEGGEL